MSLLFVLECRYVNVWRLLLNTIQKLTLQRLNTLLIFSNVKVATHDPARLSTVQTVMYLNQRPTQFKLYNLDHFY